MSITFVRKVICHVVWALQQRLVPGTTQVSEWTTGNSETSGYSDAFISLIVDVHPKASGRPLFETWPELRPTIESMLERVLNRGESVLSNDLLHAYRPSEYLEEKYLTVSFNAIVLESGKIGGSFSLIDDKRIV